MSDVPFCSSENACTEGGEQANGCEPVVSMFHESMTVAEQKIAFRIFLLCLPKQTRKLLMGLVP